MIATRRTFDSPKMVTLETSRLLLRLPTGADAGPFLDMHQNPDVIRYLQIPVPANEITAAWRNVAMMIGHWHLRGYGQWAVVEKASGQLIGRVGLWNPEGWPGVELGWLIRRSHWGQGIATEAARAALDWAWANIDTDHVISLIQPENVPSMRVAAKVGEGFEQIVTVDGATFHRYGVHRPARA